MNNSTPELSEILAHIRKSNPPEDKLITVKEVAAKLGVTVDCVWKYCSDNLIPKPVKMRKGGATRWRASEINTYIANL